MRGVMVDSPAKHFPFANGAQFRDWKRNICQTCGKQYNEEAQRWRCQIEEAVDVACITDGSLNTAMAMRLGYLVETAEEHEDYVWRCPEFEPVRPRGVLPRREGDRQ